MEYKKENTAEEDNSDNSNKLQFRVYSKPQTPVRKIIVPIPISCNKKNEVLANMPKRVRKRNIDKSITNTVPILMKPIKKIYRSVSLEKTNYEDGDDIENTLKAHTIHARPSAVDMATQFPEPTWDPVKSSLINQTQTNNLNVFDKKKTNDLSSDEDDIVPIKRQRKPLSVTEKQMILNVFHYVAKTSKLAIESYEKINKSKCVKQTADILGVSAGTVFSILKEKKDKHELSAPKKPGVPRKSKKIKKCNKKQAIKIENI